MTESRFSTPNLLSTYLNVDEGCHGHLMTGDREFWKDLMAGTLDAPNGGIFVFAVDFESDSGIWERHPQGDEIVFLMEGAVDFLLDREDGVHCIELRNPGDFALIPEGIWHKLRVVSPGKTLTINSGKGAEHRRE